MNPAAAAEQAARDEAALAGLRARVAQLEAECARLRDENTDLRAAQPIPAQRGHGRARPAVREGERW